MPDLNLPPPPQTQRPKGQVEFWGGGGGGGGYCMPDLPTTTSKFDKKISLVQRVKLSLGVGRGLNITSNILGTFYI